MFHVKQIWERIRALSIDELFFYLFVFTIPFQLRTVLNPANAYIGYYFSYHLAIFFYLSDLIFIGFLSAFVLYDKTSKRKLWPIVLPILWSIINVFHVEHFDLWLYGTLKIAEFWLIVAYLVHRPKTVKPVLIILIICGLIQALIATLQFHVQHGLGLGFLGEYIPGILDSGAATINTGLGKILRAYGTMAHPNVLGGFLTLCYAALLYVSRETYKFNEWLIVSCGTFLLFGGILVSFSRSAWLAVGLVSTFWFIYLIYKVSMKRGLIFAVIVIVSCGTLGLIYQKPLFYRIIQNSDTNQAIEYRADFNGYALDLIQVHTITGLGAGQYIPWLTETKQLEPWQYQPPHNVLLMYLTEMGAVGLIIALYTVFRLGFTWNNLNMFNLIFITALVVMGALDHYLLTIQTGFLTLAIILSVVISNKKDVSQLRETSLEE